VSIDRNDAAAVRICDGCRSELAPTFLACPRCGRLVHAERLKALAGDAEAAERAGDSARALAVWRQALALLPAGSGQHTRITEKVQALSARVGPASPFVTSAGVGGGAAAAVAVPGAAASPPRTGWRKWAAGAGAFGVVLMKFKWLLLFLLTKAKVLLLGLTQAKTFLSMGVMIGVYTTIYGWQFAVGLVVSIYIHEMGHVVWLRRFGIPATAPMFIPGVGAFVRLKAHPATAGEDARIGLAGPVWGAGAALIALVLGFATGHRVLFGVAYFGAVINVFNLLPVWQLDGNRGFAALAREGRLAVAGTFVAGWMIAGDGLFVLLILAAGGRAFSADAATANDRGALTEFVFLILALAAVFRLAA